MVHTSQHLATGASEENLAFVKHITGCVPLLLFLLLQFKDQPFDEATFLDFKELRDIQTNINDFYDHLLRGLAEEDRTKFAVSSNVHTCFNSYTGATIQCKHVCSKQDLPIS